MKSHKTILLLCGIMCIAFIINSELNRKHELNKIRLLNSINNKQIKTTDSEVQKQVTNSKSQALSEPLEERDLNIKNNSSQNVSDFSHSEYNGDNILEDMRSVRISEEINTNNRIQPQNRIQSSHHDIGDTRHSISSIDPITGLPIDHKPKARFNEINDRVTHLGRILFNHFGGNRFVKHTPFNNFI